MIFSSRIYCIILLHILLILVTLGIGIWMITSHTGYIIGSFFILISLFQIAGLTSQLNTFNRKIKLFFDAVEDKDNMLHFPEEKGGKEQAELNRALNRISIFLSKAQSEHRKQEHFYRSLLEEVPAGVIVWDASGKILLANDEALTLLGQTQFSNQQQVEQLLVAKENLSQSRTQMRLQEELLTLLSIKDIGDELSDKESESWSKLTHVLTHEIMNTIAPILSLSQSLIQYPNMDDKAVRGLKVIQLQSERLMEFTESFRHLSYLPQPNKIFFSLTTLLQNLNDLLESDFSVRNIQFHLRCTPSIIEFNGDENLLSQVFLNLLKNALQALDGKMDGVISLVVYQKECLYMEVTDNGPGILPEIQEEVFVPFFTTKPDGMGIGLSLCRQIIRQHGGHLFIGESYPGKTVFCINLPL